MRLTAIAFALVVIFALLARGSAQGPPAAQTTQPAPAAPAPQPGDELQQMRADLSRLESLNTVMSTEIEFLHDQNLQILLRTNSQMWTVVMRDLRRLIEREEHTRIVPRSQDDNMQKPEAK
jgi:hypothetical protein